MTNPPTLADFTSDIAQGRLPRRQDPEAIRLASGISVYATESQARNKARAYPFLGHYVAAVRIADDDLIRVERTLLSSRGHHTIWGDPEELVERVAAIVPV